MFESMSLRRDHLSREIGRIPKIAIITVAIITIAIIIIAIITIAI